MKAFFCIVLFAALLSIPCAHAQAQAGAAVAPSARDTAPLIAIRKVTLKPGVDPAAFERFVAQEYIPQDSRFWPGVKVMLVKGERGQDVGGYLLVYVFDSKQIRDLYFPTPDVPSDAFIGIVNANGGEDAFTALDDKFAEYAQVSADYTDYVAIE